MTPSRRFLLVTRFGRRSLHDRWLSATGPRDFDVLLSCYDTSLPAPAAADPAAGVFFEHRPGTKVAGYDAIMRDRADLLARYDFVAFFDEDLDTDAGTLNRAFALCAQYDLKIAQPGLTFGSHFSQAGLFAQPFFRLRYVNFIEMMCPIFRRDALEAIRPLYGLGLESGIDLVWCHLVGETVKDFAVLDCCALRHSEMVGARKEENGFSGGRSYRTDIARAQAMFGLPPQLCCIPSSGVLRSGGEVKSRALLFLAALTLLAAIPRQRPFGGRARHVLRHLYHIWKFPPGTRKVHLPPGWPRVESGA